MRGQVRTSHTTNGFVACADLTPLRRLADRSGQATVELMGTIWWLLLVVVLVWQVALAGWATVEASNAARTASRVAARGGDPPKAARNAVPQPLRRGLHVRVSGERATVRVRIPILFPGLSHRKFRATRGAELPS